MRPTIEEVAKRAGVSSPTVSRVLNDSKYVSPELVRRVRDAIEELNYRPNENARRLALKTNSSVGLIVPTLDDGELARFLASSAQSFNERGFELMIGKTGRRSAAELELLEAQLSSRVQGIVLAVPCVSDELRHALGRSGVPGVFVFSEDTNGRYPSIIFDNESAANALIETISHPGAKRFSIISGPLAGSPMSHRVAGCRDALGRLGVTAFAITECDGTLDSGYSNALEILEEGKPDVLVCLNDKMAIGALRACYDRGIQVPAEVEVTGFSAGEYSTVCNPPLRTVRFDSSVLGRKAADALTALIEGRPVPRLEVLGYEIQLGGSCR